MSQSSFSLFNEGINTEYSRVPFLQPPGLNTVIFPTGRHLWQDVVLATPSATLRQIQGGALHPHAMSDTALACFGRTPWIDSQGARQALRRRVTMSMTTATATTTMTRTMMATMATTTMGKWNVMEVTTRTTTTTTTLTLTSLRTTTTMGRRQWDGDEDEWTTTMRWRWAASVTQNARERRATHPRQQSTYADSLGRSRREWGTISGGGRQKRVKVEEIEWRSLHLHSINSKPTF